MARPNPTPTSTPNSTPISTPNSTSNSNPSSLDYKSMHRWAPNNLLEETSSFTSFASIATYRKKQDCHKSRVFGKEHDKFVRVVPCRIGEPVCSDESSDPEGPFCFIYSNVFRRLSLRLPFTPFEQALLPEVNVAPLNYTQIDGRSLGLSRSCAIASTIHRQWTCSCNSSKLKALTRSCG